MDIEIRTSDPDVIDADEIKAAIESRGYYVASVTVVERH